MGRHRALRIIRHLPINHWLSHSPGFHARYCVDEVEPEAHCAAGPMLRRVVPWPTIRVHCRPQWSPEWQMEASLDSPSPSSARLAWPARVADGHAETQAATVLTTETAASAHALCTSRRPAAAAAAVVRDAWA